MRLLKLMFRIANGCAAARNGRSELAWLIERFNKLPKPEKERAELYDSQQLYVRWTPRFNASRTGMRMRDQQTRFTIAVR